VCSLNAFTTAQENHFHGVPEKLGTVSFPVSCQPEVQAEFNRAVALLHSFTYSAAAGAFQKVAAQDPACAMAHWGVAMTYFHQLWEPAVPSSDPTPKNEINQALKIGASSERERGFIQAAAFVFQDPNLPYTARALNYEEAMAKLAATNPQDVEAQVFYALALLTNASPSDKTHARQKKALAVLTPLYQAYPDHPGIAHYVIHASDNAELAAQGLPAARAYAQIAPSAPHALHMPSHIFTRLGLWDDSIASNRASQDAARASGDVGEELHAMDYLVYAYLQSGRDAEAEQVLMRLKTMEKINTGEFKSGYASTAMPIRYLMERQRWAEASQVVPPATAPPHMIAIAVWARGMGLARTGHPVEAMQATADLQKLEDNLRTAGNLYWAMQVKIMKEEVAAWSAQAEHKSDAASLLRTAADEEDAVEKLPVTPGPIIPAREQLGELLLLQSQPELALQEFKSALVNAPGRRGSVQGAAEATRQIQKTADSKAN
jgi:tetratricopeptide (TPR) repeat protein